MADSEHVIKAIEQGQPSDNTRSKNSELFPGISNERDIFKSRNRVTRSPVVSPYGRPLVIRSDDGIRVITTTPSGIEVRNLHKGIRPPAPRTNPLVPPPHTINLAPNTRLRLPGPSTHTPNTLTPNTRPRLPTPHPEDGLSDTPYRKRSGTETPTSITGIDPLRTPGLTWDNQYDYVQPIAPNTNSLTTPARTLTPNMANEDTQAAAHNANLHLTILTYEEYEDYILAAYPVDILQQAMKEIHGVTTNFRHAKSYYMSIPPGEETAQLVTQATAAAKNLRELQRSISQHITDKATASLVENLTLDKDPPSAR